MATSYSAVATKPEEIISCDALDAGDFPERYAKRVEAIATSVKDSYLREKVRLNLGYFEMSNAGKLIQSSPYRLVVLQQLLPEEKRLATMERLRIARGDPDFMRGFYIDGGLNLVPCTYANEAVNAFQAGKLEADLRKAGVKTDDSILVSYHILTLKVDEKSPSGLVLRLSKEGRDVIKEGVRNTSDFEWDYSPNQGGLFSACLYDDDLWGCGVRNLDYSFRSGGVVVESAKGTSPKILQDILSRRQSAREEYLAELKLARAEIDKELTAQ
jgi:hypothetical protein